MLYSAKRGPRRAAASIVALGVSLTLFAAGSAAHPLGNFTVNHFSRLQIDRDRVQITYVIDMAEIPAFQELRAADTDGDGKTSRAEVDIYLQRAAQSYADGIVLTLDGKRRPLTMKPVNITTPPGAGGLSTLRLEYELLGATGEWALRVTHHLRFEDANQQERIGWHEIVITPNPGVTVFDSSAFSNSVSNELRSYPADMLASPLEEREAELSWVIGPAPSSAKLLRTRDGRVTTASRDRLDELIAVRRLTPGIAVLGLLLAAILGAMHALSPGHGKTVVGAYLVGSRGTPKHAAFLGLTVTITHTVGVFVLGLLTLFASRYVLPERLFPVLSLVSGALVAFIGFSLFVRRLRAAVSGAHEHSHAEHDHPYGEHEHEHGEHAHGSHAHVHSHGGRPHSHLPPGADGVSMNWRSLLALGISGGLLPCPSALVVLLSAIALHRVGYGLVLVVAFSMGLAATLTGVGLAFVYAGRWLNRFGSVPKTAFLARALPVVSSFVVACLGIGICYEAVRQAGLDPVLFIHSAVMKWHGVFSGERPLASMGALAVLMFGLILGFKHATEADHVVAVSSIVSEHRNITKVAVIGGLWGVGHTITLLLVGIVVLLLGISIPERISQYLEFGVGLMIIGLSGTALARAVRGRSDVHVHKHSHVSGEHSHLHFHEQGTAHNHSFEPHSHPTSRVGLKPVVVGAMHGLAGSAALTLLVLTQIRSVLVGLSYLLLFGIGSLLGMMAVSIIIGVPFALSARRLTNVTLGLQAALGLVGVGFGCWYAYSVGIAAFG
ncbi:MAG: sulfite exporter TauE/SafE family protein [Bryobacteraceae bacterium]